MDIGHWSILLVYIYQNWFQLSMDGLTQIASLAFSGLSENERKHRETGNKPTYISPGGNSHEIIAKKGIWKRLFTST
jgi:hypothetical protein